MSKKILILTILMFSILFTECGREILQDNNSSNNSKIILKIGASPVPHAEILKQIKSELEDQGIVLEVIEFNDYIQPNIALNDGEIDANFFQHEPYLNNFMKEHTEMKLKNAAAIHIEPMGIYSKKFKNLNDLDNGFSVSIPNDPTNGGRALLLLEKANLIQLRKGVEAEATVQDIIANPRSLAIIEVEAAQLARTLEDVDISIINTNFALNAGLNPLKDALFMEDKDSPFANIIAVRDGDNGREDIQKLLKCLKSDEIKDFLNVKYNGVIIPAF